MGESAVAVLLRRGVGDARVRTVAFGYVFAVYAWLQAAGYRSTYPTAAARSAFARVFAGNDAIRLFYGYPYDVRSVGGYSAWRVGGLLAVAAAAFGVLAAVRVLRGEEEAGRTEVVLANPVARRSVLGAGLATVAVATAVLWLAEVAGFVAGRLPVGGSAYLALATVSVVPVFAGVGALSSQLAPTRRGALALASAVLAVFLLLRVVADTWSAGGWLRALSPFGWAEELRPFAGSRPVLLVLPLSAAAGLWVVAALIWRHRDVGMGLVGARDEAAPRVGLLSSPSAQALRAERGVLVVWVAAIALFSAVLGMVSTSISGAGVSERVQQDFAKFGSGPLTKPAGYLAFVFIVFVLAVSLFVCAQVGAAREMEVRGQLETVLAQPVGRSRWLGGRLLIAALAAVGLSSVAGLVTWAGATSQGVGVSLARMLEAAANCVPMAVLFLGLGALAYALVPRVSGALSYGLVGLAFLWYIVGSLLGLPGWVVDLTPFRHIGLVPVQAFDPLSAVVMAAIGLLAAGLALAAFRRRDLLGA